MKKKVLSTLVIGVVGFSSYAFSSQILAKWPFSAPSLDNPDAIGTSKSQGDIVFNASTSKFVGWDGSAWLDLGGSGSSAPLSVVSVSSSGTLSAGNDVILASASSPITLALPSAAANLGKVFTVKKVDSNFNAITISAYSGEAIDGSASTTINTKGEAITFVSDGVDWEITQRKIPSNWSSDYTFTLNAVSTNPTRGTVVRDKARWRRVGSKMEIIWDYEQSTGGTAGAGIYLFPMLPAGVSMDSTQVNIETNGDGTILGTSRAGFANANPATQAGIVTAYDSTRFMVTTFATSNGHMQSGGSFGFGTTLNISMSISVPISGWNE